MARTRTLELMRGEVRDRADIEGALHITDTQIDRYLNQSGAALHAMLVEHCQDEFIEVFSGTTAAASGNQTNISLAAVPEGTDGAYKIVGVEVEVDGLRRRLNRWSWQEHARAIDVSSTLGPYLYRWVSYTVQVIPGLPTGTPYYIYAIPPFVDMAADESTLDGRDGWEEWVIWDAAIKCMVKEETDTREAVQERETVLARIKSQMKARDFANPPEVASVGNPWSYEVD